MMKIAPASLPEVKIIYPQIWQDERGFLLESCHTERYRAMLGLADLHFVQSNYTHSRRGALRGLHFQPAHPQGKLLTVLAGEIFDVAVDVRPHSPTFGQWTGNLLHGRNKQQCWIPPGFAHGFQVISARADCLYHCTAHYHPQNEACLLWSDPAIGINWVITDPVLSEKDRQGQSLAELTAHTLANGNGTAS